MVHRLGTQTHTYSITYLGMLRSWQAARIGIVVQMCLSIRAMVESYKILSENSNSIDFTIALLRDTSVLWKMDSIRVSEIKENMPIGRRVSRVCEHKLEVRAIGL